MNRYRRRSFERACKIEKFFREMDRKARKLQKRSRRLLLTTTTRNQTNA